MWRKVKKIGKIQKTEQFLKKEEERLMHVKETVSACQAAYNHSQALSKPLKSWLDLHLKNSFAIQKFINHDGWNIDDSVPFLSK